MPVPPPPELPKYDPSIEAPKWDWYRLWYSTDYLEPDPNIPKTGGQPASDEQPDWRGVIKKNVIPLPPPERYDFGNYVSKSYYWFDTPDWADPFKKLKFATIFFLKYGLAATGIYGGIVFQDFSAENTRHLIRKPFARFFLGGITASLAVVTIANLRGNKDDYWNYVLGGFVAGSVVGRSHPLSFVRQVAMWVPAAVVVKYVNETNAKLIPILDFRVRNAGPILGSAGEYGFKSGDWRPNILTSPYDSRRDARTHPGS